MVFVPQPTSLDSVQSWRRDVQRAMEASGSRVLESASISNGTLRVVHDGNITISDGGHFVLGPGSRLLLGKGQIDGAALKEQFEPVAIDLEKDTRSFSSTTTWKTVRTTTVNAPAWASTGLVMVTASLSANQVGTFTYLSRSSMRLLVNGASHGELMMANYSYYQGGNEYGGANGNLTITTNIPLTAASRSIKLDLQALITVGNGSIKDINTAIGGLVIWTR